MAQTEQKKGRKSDSRIRFNIIDLVIIVVVVACIAGIYLRYNFGEQYGVEHQMEQYEITFQVQNVLSPIYLLSFCRFLQEMG